MSPWAGTRSGSETVFFRFQWPEPCRLPLANGPLQRKTEPIRCVIDTVNDASEISLDKNDWGLATWGLTF
jgi:hypothetical protein